MIKIYDEQGKAKIFIEDKVACADILTQLPSKFMEWVKNPFMDNHSTMVIKITNGCSFILSFNGVRHAVIGLNKGDYILPNEKD
jgi:hypothetical protein